MQRVSEIVKRNVKQVIQILIDKGYNYQQVLVNQYLNGSKSQYQFLLPKSRHYRYYTQQLALNQLNQQRQRKLPELEQIKHLSPEKQIQNPQKLTRTITVLGTVQEVSVGAMCELVKQLRQNKQPYEPFDNQVYQQQLTITLQDENLNKKVQSIMEMINAIKIPIKQDQFNKQIQKTQTTTKMDMLRSELGTEKDGSLGGWGGKKYEGLGMRDQFTNYRKQTSKNFYQAIPR